MRRAARRSLPLVLSLSLLPLGLASPATAGELSLTLSPVVHFGGLNYPHDFRADDLNGDGFPDFMILGGDGTMLKSVLFRGRNCFDPTRMIVFGGVFDDGREWGISGVGDVNGDSFPDVVVSGRKQSGNPNRVVVLANDGAGRLTRLPESSWPSGNFLRILAALEGDAIHDIIWVDEGLVSVYAGDGAGGFAFASSVPFAEPVSELHDLVAADFDADGLVDLGCAYRTSVGSSYRFAVFPGELGGGLGAPVTTNVTMQSGSDVDQVEAADFDADGDLDAALLDNSGFPDLVLLRGDGALSFTESALPLGQLEPESIAVGHLDSDGIIDLLVVSTSSGDASVFFRGDPTLGLVGPTPVPHLVGKEAVILDLNGDSWTDIVAWPSPAFFGDGAGNFAAIEPESFPAGPETRGPVAGDFDGDGRMDVVVAQGGDPEGTGFVGFLAGDGTGGFAPSVVSPSGARPFGLAFGDFDHDDDLDLAVQKSLGSNVFIQLNDGLGSFPIAYGFTSLADATSLAAHDFDEDGTLDLVMGHSTQFAIRLGTGVGTFLPPTFVAGSRFVGLGDVDEDGNADIVCAEDILYGDGSGGFTPMSLGTVTDVNSVVDMDADGHLDIVRARLSVDFGDGTGAFPTATFVDDLVGDLEPVGSVRLFPHDIDEDGSVDLLIGPGAIYFFLLADGDRGFRWSGDSHRFLPTLLADFDGDCHTDIGSVIQFGSPSRDDTVEVVFNRMFDPVEARRGNVNAAAGPIVDVLFVNGTAGTGDERVVTLGQDDPITIFMANAPSRARSPFVLYKWLFEPTTETVQRLPFGLGTMAAGPPFDLGCSPPHKHEWNNIGKPAILGPATHPSVKAPSEVFTSPGLGRPVTWYLQGFVLDHAAPNGIAAVTNGILLRVE